MEVIVFLQVQRFSIASMIVLGLLKTSMRSFSRTTYIATFSNGNSVVLPDEEYFKTARMQIGDLAPLARLLTEHEGSLLVYLGSRFVSYAKSSTYSDYLLPLLPLPRD